MQKSDPTYTRKINPKLGLFGFLGFLGFTGFIPIFFDLTTMFPVPSFFFFFAFFGFFGFYFEGKMSNTLIDERFRLNASRAAAAANKAALSIILAASIFITSLAHTWSTYISLSILLAIIGLAFGLAIFLEQYLLYRFESE